MKPVVVVAGSRHVAPPPWELAAWWALAHSQSIGSRLVPGLPNLSIGGGGWQSIRQRNRAGQGQTGRAWGTFLEDLERRLAHVRIVCGDYRRLFRRTVLLMCRGNVNPYRPPVAGDTQGSLWGVAGALR